jgi:hypothetical protein
MLLALLAPALLPCASALWAQDRFASSFWVDPQVPPQDMDARFAEIAGANFTAHLGFNSGPNPYPPNPTQVAAQLAAAAKHGLKSIPSICENCASPESCGIPYHNGGTCRHVGQTSDALWGFQLADEPSATLFPALRNWTQSIAAANPDALRFINLLPACAGEKLSGVKGSPMTCECLSASCFGTVRLSDPGSRCRSSFPRSSDITLCFLSNYSARSACTDDEYVGNFTAIVEPQVLSMDSYPTFGQPLAVRKTPLFEPFIYENEHFTKTGSGQT